jgi:hypothetical protein
MVSDATVHSQMAAKGMMEMVSQPRCLLVAVVVSQEKDSTMDKIT